MASRDLHALAGKLVRDMRERSIDLSDRQEWLFDQIVLELEWRRRIAGWRGCSCLLCVPPFPD